MNFYGKLQVSPTRNAERRGDPVSNALSTLGEKMLEKYNCSQAYSELQIINHILDEEPSQNYPNKKPHLDRILLNDMNFMESQEYMEILYEEGLTQQLTDLFEYYKYYLQDPTVCFREYYDLMHRYYERRKGHVYNELKKILTLSEVDNPREDDANESSVFEPGRMAHDDKKSRKIKQKGLDTGLANILAEISVNRTSHKDNQFDESIHFNELRRKLVKFYGPPSGKSMQTIDNIYNFAKSGQDHQSFKNQPKFYHGAQINPRKEIGQIVGRNFTKKNNHFKNNTSTRILESTNISHSQRNHHNTNVEQEAPYVDPKQIVYQKRDKYRKTSRRYKSTGNSQEHTELNSHENITKCLKSPVRKKQSAKFRKSSELFHYRNRYNNNEEQKYRKVCRQGFESRHSEEDIQPIKTSANPKKRKYSGRVKSTETLKNMQSLQLVKLNSLEPYLKGTIAKFKRRIQQQKDQLANEEKQKKGRNIVGAKGGAGRRMRGGNQRLVCNNLSQHCQSRKKEKKVKGKGEPSVVFTGYNNYRI